MLVGAYDADGEIEAYIRFVRDEGRARCERTSGRSRDGMDVFALDVLAPSRLRNTRRFLNRARVDTDALRAFLDYSSGIAKQAIEAASTRDDVADAVIDALDELHVYLLAHNLVSNRYLESEFAEFGEDSLDGPEPTCDRSGIESSTSTDIELAVAA